MSWSVRTGGNLGACSLKTGTNLDCKLSPTTCGQRYSTTPSFAPPGNGDLRHERHKQFGPAEVRHRMTQNGHLRVSHGGHSPQSRVGTTILPANSRYTLSRNRYEDGTNSRFSRSSPPSESLREVNAGSWVYELIPPP